MNSFKESVPFGTSSFQTLIVGESHSKVGLSKHVKLSINYSLKLTRHSTTITIGILLSYEFIMTLVV